MKTRNGFVSNSSSSSFVVSIKDPTKTTIKIEIEVDLSAYGKVIKTLDELKDYCLNDYGFAEEELEDSEMYQDSKNAIEQGKAVIIGSFSSNGDSIAPFLYDYGFKHIIKNADVEIIQAER